MNSFNDFADIENEIAIRSKKKKNLKRSWNDIVNLSKNPFQLKKTQVLELDNEIFDTLSDISTDDSDAVQITHFSKKRVKIPVNESVISIESDDETVSQPKVVSSTTDYLTSSPEYHIVKKVDFINLETSNSRINNISNSSSSSSSPSSSKDLSDVDTRNLIHLDDDAGDVSVVSETPAVNSNIKIESGNAEESLGNNEKKKRRTKRKSQKRFPNNPELRNDNRMFKYWSQRYDLFERFDMGIKLDKESWYSVTAEYIAKEQANLCKETDIILDGFCGAGGNTIQFSYKSSQVIALDIDPIKIGLTKNNCKVYGVDMSKVIIMKEDYYSFANHYNSSDSSLNFVKMPVIDVVFLSPPWGGQDYLNNKLESQSDDLLKHTIDIEKLLTSARRFKPKTIMIFLPRNTNETELQTFLQENETVEIVKHAAHYKQNSGKKIKAITAVVKCNL